MLRSSEFSRLPVREPTPEVPLRRLRADLGPPAAALASTDTRRATGVAAAAATEDVEGEPVAAEEAAERLLLAAWHPVELLLQSSSCH